MLEKERGGRGFQPVFSRQTGEVFGYEALARLREARTIPCNIMALFQRTQAEGIISTLDMLCRENAFCGMAKSYRGKLIFP